MDVKLSSLVKSLTCFFSSKDGHLAVFQVPQKTYILDSDMEILPFLLNRVPQDTKQVSNLKD